VGTRPAAVADRFTPNLLVRDWSVRREPRRSSAGLVGPRSVPAPRRRGVREGHVRRHWLKVGKIEDGVTELRIFLGAPSLVPSEKWALEGIESGCVGEKVGSECYRAPFSV